MGDKKLDMLDTLLYSTYAFMGARQTGKTYLQKMLDEYQKIEDKDIQYFKQNYLGQWNIKDEFYINPYGINMNINNKQEEQKSMLQCEFALGNVWVGKNEIDDENDGELVLIAPGYNSDNFGVTQTNKGVRIEVYKMPCENCGEVETEVLFFEFSDLYEVVDVKHNVRDGILVVQVIYDLGEAVEVDEDL